MSWLIVVIISYFLFSLVSLGDKYILAGPPRPKIYSFGVGILGISSLALIPFVGFSLPALEEILLCFLAGGINIFALLALYQGLEKFEASRIIPAIGGFLPLFTFLLVYLFSGGKETLGLWEILAFLFLVLGSVFVSRKPGEKVSFRSFRLSVLAAFLFALYFVLIKFIFLVQPFWNGFIWIRIGAFLTALFFIFSKEVREGIIFRRFSFNKKTGVLFVLNQGLGAGAVILQSWAVALAGLAYLSIINALQGIQYVFLFVFAALFSKVFKEKVSSRAVFQKIIAILIIGAGLAILALK